MGYGSYGSWVKYLVGHMGHESLEVTHRLPCMTGLSDDLWGHKLAFLLRNACLRVCYNSATYDNILLFTIGAEPGGWVESIPPTFFPHKYINVTTHKFSYSKNFSFTEFKKRRQISNMYYVNIILLICFSDSCHISSRSVNGELIPVYLVNFYFLVHPSYI